MVYCYFYDDYYFYHDYHTVQEKEIDPAKKESTAKKAPGPDDALTAKVLKDGGHTIRQILFSMCNLVFNECCAPTQ